MVQFVCYRSKKPRRSDPEYRGFACRDIFPTMRHFGLVLNAIPFTQEKISTLQSQRNFAGQNMYQLLACVRGNLRTFPARGYPNQYRFHLAVATQVCQPRKEIT